MSSKKFISVLVVLTLLAGLCTTHVFAAGVTTYPTTDIAREVTNSSASISGRAYTNPEANIDEWGVAYSKSKNASNPFYEEADEEQFIIELTNLSYATTYYYRTYIRYYDNNDRKQIAYGTERSFKTLSRSSSSSTPTPTPAPGDAVVNVPRLSALSSVEALAESSFIANGNTVKYAGFVFSETNSMPTRDNTDLYDQVNSQTSMSFSKRLTQLSKNTTYYVRAYISVYNNNSSNLTDVYSPVASFTSSTSTSINVYTSDVRNINISGADIVIDVLGGIGSIVERGVVFSTKDQAPELYSSASKYKTISGTTGEATVTLSELDSNTTYYARAYVRNNDTVFYGDTERFVTRNALDIVTGRPINITSTTAVAVGELLNASSFMLQEKGFVYSNSEKKPTTHDLKVNVESTKSGEYALDLKNLSTNTTYYLRAYALSNDNVSYGDVVEFTTTGQTLSTNVTYRTIANKVVGTETVQGSLGSTLTLESLKLPTGYQSYTSDWSYVVPGIADIFVTVTETRTDGGAFITGMSNNRFEPDRPATRAEIAEMIYNLKGNQKYLQGKTFSDVSDIHKSKAAIDYVSASGIMTGYPDGTFLPNSTISRAEMCVVLSGVYALTGSTSTTAFSDVKDGVWYSQSVALAYNNSMLSGYPDGTFKPPGLTSRAEACSIFVRAEKRSLTPIGTALFADVPMTHWAYSYIMSASVPTAY